MRLPAHQVVFMDTTTLILVDAVLAASGLRPAARQTGRPAATIAAALARMEAALSVPLAERAGSGLALTLEARRLAVPLARVAALARTLYAPGTDPFASAVKLQALERFDEIAAHGSIRRAARGLGMGQPQLTRQVAHMEAALGHVLLQRGNGGSALTPEGEAVHATARELLALWHELSRTAGARFRKAETTVRLGSVIPLGYESEIARQLANLTASWLKQRPRQPLFVSSTTAEDLLRGLKSGLYDIAFLDTEELPPDLDGAPISTTPLALIGADGGAASVAAALDGRQLAVPSARSGLRQRIDRVLADHLCATERDALTLIEIDSIPVILNLVLHHGFVSVLPQASTAAIRPDLPRLPLPGAYDMRFWLCWVKGSGRESIGRAVLEVMARLPA
jgi:LysR family nitrogen assimilation transcriptional regulator